MTKTVSSPDAPPTAPKEPKPAEKLDRYGMREADALHRDLSFAVIAFHEALARRSGMSAVERKVFSLLAMEGSATPSHIAKESGLTTGAITGIVDRLERAGLAKREPNPNDRRSLIVKPLQVQKVHDAHLPAFQSLTKAMNDMRAHFSPDDLKKIHAYLSETIAVLRAETAKLEGETKKERAAKD